MIAALQLIFALQILDSGYLPPPGFIDAVWLTVNAS